MRKYFVSFQLNGGQAGNTEITLNTPLHSISTVRVHESETARDLVRRQIISTEQLPLVITNWRPFELPE